jgi:hypothetical protein
LAEGNNFLDSYHGWWIMVLSVRSGDKTPKHAMENISVTETKKGTHVKSSSEDNAHLFFWSQGHCSVWVSWIRSNSQPALLFRNIGKVTWGCSSEKTWTLAWCLYLASWQCPAHDKLAVREFLAMKSILK